MYVETIKAIEYALKPQIANDETLALATIQKVGPGGLYLKEKHTLKNARTAPFYSPLTDPLKDQKEPQESRTRLAASREIQRLLANYSPPPLSPETRRQAQTILKRQGASQTLLGHIDHELTTF